VFDFVFDLVVGWCWWGVLFFVGVFGVVGFVDGVIGEGDDG